MRLVPQPANEVDIEPRAVQAPVEFEKVRLQEPLAPADGRPRADRGDARMAEEPRAGDAHREDACDRRDATVQPHVGSGEAERTAELLARNDPPAHAVVAA